MRLPGLADRLLMVKNKFMRCLPSLFAIAALTILPGAGGAIAQTADAGQLEAGAYRWLEEGPFEGPLYLIISLRQQMVHVYSGDRLIGMASVSTGTRSHRTPTGEFPILQKREWHRSNLYSNAPMPFMQRLTWDGVALHAGHNPGYPASHGCIRLPTAFARKLFTLTQLGTLVRVNADELRPALMLDQLVLNDPGTAIVTFTPDAKPVPAPVQQAGVQMAVRETAAPAPIARPDVRQEAKKAPMDGSAVQTAAKEMPVQPSRAEPVARPARVQEKESRIQLAAQDAPSLSVDPSVFRPRLRR